MQTRCLITCACSIAAALFAAMAPGEEYPASPIRIITSTIGGGTDFTSRIIAQGLTESLGKRVIVDNRGSSVVTGAIVAKAPPDGYTLLTAANSFWHGPLLRKVPYHPIRDFAPITLAVTAPQVLVVHPSLPVKTIKELVALAKSRPGELNFGTSGNGTSSHLSAELFKSMVRVDMVRINYKGNGPAYAALLSGEVQVMVASPGGLTIHLKSGRVRALAVTSAEPSPLFPGIPTLAASGLPGYESTAPHGIVAPAKTPPGIIDRLNTEIVRVLTRPDVKEKFFNTGIEVVASTPEQFAAFMRADMERWGKVIKGVGIRVD